MNVTFLLKLITTFSILASYLTALMISNKVSYLLFLCFASQLCSSVYSQSFTEIQFVSFVNQDYTHYNPAVLDFSQKQYLSPRFQRFFGAKKIINTSTLAAGTQLGPESSFHAGTLIKSFNSGPFIQFNRVGLNLTYQLFDDRDQELKAGLGLDYVNLRFKSGQNFQGASDANFDAKLGLWYSYSNFTVGLSFRNLFEPSLNPLEEETTLTQKINTIFIYKHSFSTSFVYHPHLIVDLEPRVTLLISSIHEMDLSNFFGVLFSHQNFSLLHFGGYLKDLRISSYLLNIQLVSGFNIDHEKLNRSMRYEICFTLFQN